MIAERWHVPPFFVDSAPADEVALELRFLSIESEASEG
jgi:hypothetical protein